MQIFTEVLHEILTYVSDKYIGAKIIIAGDFNINFLKDSAEKRDIVTNMLSYDLYLVFKQPSRLSKHTSTCIDQMFTNIGAAAVSSTKTIQPHLSDHLAQMLNFVLDDSRTNSKTYMMRREMNEVNTLIFINMLTKVNWEEIYLLHPQNQFTAFHGTVVDCLNTACPNRRIAVNNKQFFNYDWHTDHLRAMKNNLDALYVINRVLNTEESKIQYDTARQYYKKEVKMSKSVAVTNKINSSDNSQKTIWQIIKSETNKQEQELNESKLTAEELNLYFRDVGETIAASIPGPANSASVCMTRRQVGANGSFFVAPVDQAEIIDIVKSLKNKSTRDVYDLSTGLLKGIIAVILEPLTKLVNNCLLLGMFPEELKIAKIVPIHKTGSHDEASNYRPISILPTISKIFEIVIRNRLVNYLEGISMFANEQYGFRRQRSTISAILDLLDQVAETLDRKEEIKLLCSDLSKAFDSVDHYILLQKLEYWGIRGIALDLMKSYIEGRQQLVHWNGKTSNIVKVKSGVPQGSILGPLLFIIYINDLPVNVQCAGSYLYADDASFLCGVEVVGATERVAAEAEEWFCANRLKMNIEKTQSLLFSTKTTRKETLKFLGIHISSDLTWREHIDYLQHQLASSIFAIRRIRQIAGPGAAKLAYFGCFHSKAVYGIALWGGCGAARQIFLQQKEAIRAVVGVTRTTSCRDIFKDLNILTLPAIYILTCLTFVHNTNKFHTHSDIHNYNTRGKHDIAYPLHRIARTQAAANHLGLKLYNSLPEVVRNHTKNKFKTVIKDVLLDNSIYSVQEFFELDTKKILCA